MVEQSAALPDQDESIVHKMIPFEEACPKVIQTYTKPKEEDLAPSSGNSIKISEIFRFRKLSIVVWFEIYYVLIKTLIHD